MSGESMALAIVISDTLFTFFEQIYVLNLLKYDTSTNMIPNYSFSQLKTNIIGL
jgi:hypothetical protein